MTASIAVTLFFSACKEEKDIVPALSVNSKTPVSVKNGRLAFENDAAFSSLIKESITQKEPKLILERPEVKSFVNNSLARTSAEKDTLTDYLVPDQYFANLLNEDRELQIGTNIIKITPEGTYICMDSKYDRLKEILSSKPKHGNNDDPNDKAGDHKDLESGIYFYDSFAAPGKSERISFSIAPMILKQDPNARTTFNYLPQYVYNTFETHSFGSHTIVGGWIESALGRREVQYVQLGNSDERLKLNFYCVNYIVFSSIGMTAQAQHKTWIGWGGDLTCNEMRMGWDGVNFETPMPYAMPYKAPSVSFDKLKLADLDINVATYSYWFANYLFDGTIADPYVAYLAKKITGQVQSTFSSTIKEVYDYVYEHVAPLQYDFYTRQSTNFRLYFPDKVTQFLGRHEEVEENVNTMSRNFDFATCQIGFSLNGDGTFGFKFSDQALTYKVKQASVYAGAYRSGVWKGVRIIKEN